MYNLRRKLKLFAGGRIISYGATTGGPATIAGLFYDEIISKPIMQGKADICCYLCRENTCEKTPDGRGFC